MDKLTTNQVMWKYGGLVMVLMNIAILLVYPNVFSGVTLVVAGFMVTFHKRIK